MICCIDIGNTNSKVGYFDDYRLEQAITINTELIVQHIYDTVIPDKNHQFIYVSSVVEDITTKLNQIKDDRLIIVKSMDYILKNYINIDKIETVGTDRIMNVLGILEYGRCPALIIDFGTALTIDIINNKFQYCGGIIFPGINLALKALYLNTSKLPKIDFKNFDNDYGTNTPDCILAGFNKGYYYLLNGFIQDYKKEFNIDFVVGTGGFVETISLVALITDVIDSNLTIKGLLKYHEISR